jgi:hypothetical protein
MTLAEHNNVQLLWVPGCKGIEGNETADQLAKRGLLQPFIGHEPASGIPVRVARQVIRDQGVQSTNNAGSPPHDKDKQRVNRTQSLKGPGLQAGCDSPVCGRCHMETETASHILCECVALAGLRLRCLGKHFVVLSDYIENPLCKILYFIRGMGLLAE